MAASDALVGEGLSISPWKEVLAERDALAARLAAAPVVAHVDGRWCDDLHCGKCYSADFRFRHAALTAERDTFNRLYGEAMANVREHSARAESAERKLAQAMRVVEAADKMRIELRASLTRDCVREYGNARAALAAMGK